MAATSIKISGLDKEPIKGHPREFALFTQAKPSDGQVQLERLQRIVGEYGSKDQAASLGVEGASFKQLASALHQPPTHPDAEGSGDCLGFAARDSGGVLSPLRFQRREVGPEDVRIQIAFCGICHSDLHQIKNEWKHSKYPMVPGHEIIGVVTEVGSAVSNFKVGDVAGVGCMVDSCQSCKDCKRGQEQFCDNFVLTYNSADKEGRLQQGGYSTHIVVNNKFVLHIPANLPLDAAAPLLCAGITTYSPLKYYGLDKPGVKVGVVGLGGLGHMAVQLAKAMGCEVTVISTSPGKKEEALGRLGAHKFLVSRDEQAMKEAAGTLDGIIDTVSANHDLNLYLPLLGTDGKLVVVGLPEKPLSFPAASVILKRKLVGGSSIGGIKETQEMLDFCGKHNITCQIEKIKIDYVNTAMERLVKNDVKYRFVIDVQGSLVA